MVSGIWYLHLKHLNGKYILKVFYSSLRNICLQSVSILHVYKIYVIYAQRLLQPFGHQLRILALSRVGGMLALKWVTVTFSGTWLVGSLDNLLVLITCRTRREMSDATGCLPLPSFQRGALAN